MLGFLIAFPFQKTNANQFFDDTGTGCRGSQTFAFHLIWHLVRPGSFHALQERIFGEVLRRGGLSFLDFRTGDSHFIANRNRRECLFLFVRFCRTALPGKSFPTIMQDGFSLGRERCSTAVQFNDCLFVSVRISHSHEKAGGNQLQNCKLALRKLIQIAFLQFSGRDNGMMVCDLFVIHNLLRMDRYIIHTWGGEYVESHIYEVWQIVCHIVRQVSAVGTGISDQRLFIKVLGVIQSLLCRIAQHTVGVSLQTGQIIERRRLFTFLLAFCLGDHSGRAISADCFGIRLLFEAFACCRKPIQSNLNRVKGFRFESGNGSFTHDCHCKGGSHDSTNIQGLPIKG